MAEPIADLTDRERETLRLLLRGHDAKSIARRLDLSGHTVNERLRDSRRKLGVSSSREAARLLFDHEQFGANTVGDKEFGVVRPEAKVTGGRQPDLPHSRGYALAWLGGGMLLMSLLIAISVIAVQGGDQLSPTPAMGVTSIALSKAAVTADATPALQWAALLDAGRWDDSWKAAGAMFRSQMPRDRWVSTIQGVRRPLGRASGRTLRSDTETSSLPGAPGGRYRVLQFATNFVGKPGAIESIVLASENSGWKVAGYFIR